MKRFRIVNGRAEPIPPAFWPTGATIDWSEWHTVAVTSMPGQSQQVTVDGRVVLS